jgi:cytoskeletal protein RodZ
LVVERGGYLLIRWSHPGSPRRYPLMLVTERRQPWLWAAIVAVALLLLVGILVTVVMVSARLRQAERTMVIQPAPPSVPLSPPPASTRAPVAATPPGTSPSPPATRVAGSRERSAQVAERPQTVVQRPAPVKVIEKQVKVVEKQVKVVEKPVKVVQKPARAPVPATAEAESQLAKKSFRDTGLPNQLTYDGATWNASEVVRGLPADLLIADSEKVDGRSVYHDHNAAAPYPHVYLRVAGQTDRYVLYVPTAS